MKKTFQIFLILLFWPSVWAVQENNNFYDNSKTYTLQGPEIYVGGEVENPGVVQLEKLRKRSVLVREVEVKQGDGIKFVGAYRYDGFSIFDILEERYVNKRNKGEFAPVVDLIVVVENKKGEKVVISWGEIYYPANLHKILIATHVSPILPTKTDQKWPLPTKTKLVCGDDFLTIRNIEQPFKITVMTPPLDFKGDRDISPLYSESIDLYENKEVIDNIRDIDHVDPQRTYPSIFYGRGRGFHGVHDFKGRLLKSLLSNYFENDEMNLKSGYFFLTAVDGYRITLSFSEVFNRNDCRDFLLIDEGKDKEGGKFRLFPAPDFFSDRAIKAIQAIHFMNL